MLTRRKADEVRAYCRLAQRDGLTLRRAVREFRVAGGKVRTLDFLRVWNEVQAETDASA